MLWNFLALLLKLFFFIFFYIFYIFFLKFPKTSLNAVCNDGNDEDYNERFSCSSCSCRIIFERFLMRSARITSNLEFYPLTLFLSYSIHFSSFTNSFVWYSPFHTFYFRIFCLFFFNHFQCQPLSETDSQLLSRLVLLQSGFKIIQLLAFNSFPIFKVLFFFGFILL